ncbi:choline ABC transporter ATP-binding protein [Paracoccus sp. N5]|uniref:choline ABC transporter ATP-binding protein n=1 Tax=Paracoccus sp. N5 TaxID=1101189 RepID=UPI000368F7AE|nr:choline ABC transporter ATP-binding protein [Paracoccus sp. N5]
MTERAVTGRNAVEFDNVNIVFGDRPEAALPLMDQGLARGPIKAETGQVLGVHNCSLTVKEGEILVLMGLSGSGKSTLLRAVNGLNSVCRGDVRVWDGDRMASVSKARGAELRRLRRERIAMVFQQFGLLPWRTVRENVGLGLELAGMPAAERARRVDAQLATVNLTEWADRKVGDLSGGMQQRVGLARAFATEAPILLMDEPFSALDPLIRNRLQDELLELQKRLRRTIIFVSHDLDEAFRIGNRIALMEGGRIVQIGTAREIIAKPVDAYVEDFVAHMNPLAVLTAEDIAEPGEAPGTPIDRETPVREVMRSLAASRADALPLQGGGRITQAGILNRLAVEHKAGGAVEH